MNTKPFIGLLILLFSFSIQAVEFKGINQSLVGSELTVSPQFDVEISSKVRHAINSGIVITFVMQAKVNQAVDWWFDTTLESKIQTYEVRYFSLSNQYQLHNRHLKTKESFVELDQLLQHMSHQTTFVFNDSLQGDYVTSRIFLDKQALPSIMQLPNVFDADWNLNSDWQTTDIIHDTPTADSP